MKRIISLSTVVLLLLTFTSSVLADSKGNKEQEPITLETIITEKNVYSVLDYLDLDHKTFVKPNEIKKMNNSQVNQVNKTITVKELQDAIKEQKSKPSNITIKNNLDNQVELSNNLLDTKATKASYPVRTVFKDSNVGIATVRYTASATYSYGGTERRWHTPTSANISVVGTKVGYSSSVEKIRTLRTSIQGTLLQVDYDYTLGNYLFVSWGALKVGDQNVNGYVTFRP